MVVGVIGLVLIGASSALAAPGDTIVRLTLDGVVDPFSASYIETAIDRANQDGPSAILITIDTPGGLDTSMRKIIQSILASEVPVICYVSPDGARAASAGTFILMSCPIAAMAPGTNVGAAHPVGVSGAIAGEKATNDAAGYIRSLAEEKGRNADWAEEAVRDSDSISAAEALRMDVIDLVSPSISGLLDEVDGRTVRVAGGTEVVLATAGAEVVERDQGLGGRILHPLFSPNYAFIFFYLGLSLIIIEILAPGVSIPGILGTIFVSIALASFGMLPVQIIGLVLLAASVGFFLVELHAPGVGAPAIGGVVSLIAGGLLLFDRSVPGAQVSPGVIAPVAMGIALFFYFVVKAALKTRHLPQSVKSQAALGATGYATTDLAPGGIVHVAAETWTAEATGPVAKGQKVRVIGVEGLRLRVEPIDDEPQQLELEE
ncbi:MAG: nodulation protein NfeD [Actinomycetota bacterium]